MHTIIHIITSTNIFYNIHLTSECLNIVRSVNTSKASINHQCNNSRRMQYLTLKMEGSVDIKSIMKYWT